MQGVIEHPAGSSRPPISIGSWSLRTTIGSTGRSRSVSLTTASAYSSSPAAAPLGVLSLAGGGLLGRARELVGVPDEPLHGPGQRVGRGLVTRDQEGHQLVAQLGVAHRAAVLVAPLEQQAEDVVALLEVGRPPPGGDLVEHEL